jgi:hydroxymethylbilane synthase
VTERLRVGTRRSPLARIQTDRVLARLAAAAPEYRFEAVLVDTSGDRDRSTGGSPDFTDAIDRALLRGTVDLAVHSAKDLPVDLDRRIALVACPPREDPRDALVLPPSRRHAPLPRGARVGSSSLRRRAQLLRFRPDLSVVEIRGNVDTRLSLVHSGAIDAAVLAVAGLTRLGRRTEVGRILPTTGFLPAPAQGALAVVARSGDAELARAVAVLGDPATRACVAAERAFASTLGGDCQVPLGALARCRGRTLSLTGEVLTPDGRTSLRRRRAGPSADPAAVGARLGAEMLDRGARDLLERVR